jgi:hypothetical protein
MNDQKHHITVTLRGGMGPVDLTLVPSSTSLQTNNLKQSEVSSITYDITESTPDNKAVMTWLANEFNLHWDG